MKSILWLAKWKGKWKHHNWLHVRMTQWLGGRTRSFVRLILLTLILCATAVGGDLFFVYFSQKFVCLRIDDAICTGTLCLQYNHFCTIENCARLSVRKVSCKGPSIDKATHL